MSIFFSYPSDTDGIVLKKELLNYSVSLDKEVHINELPW